VYRSVVFCTYFPPSHQLFLHLRSSLGFSRINWTHGWYYFHCTYKQTYLSNVLAVNFDTSTSPVAKWWVHHEHDEFHLLPILVTYSSNDRLCVILPAPPQSASRKFPRRFLTNYVCLYCLPVSCMPSRLACWLT